MLHLNIIGSSTSRLQPNMWQQAGFAGLFSTPRFMPSVAICFMTPTSLRPNGLGVSAVYGNGLNLRGGSVPTMPIMQAQTLTVDATGIHTAKIGKQFSDLLERDYHINKTYTGSHSRRGGEPHTRGRPSADPGGGSAASS